MRLHALGVGSFGVSFAVALAASFAVAVAAVALSGFDFVGELVLNNDKPTIVTTNFTAKPLIIDERNKNAKAEEEEIPLGAKLIAKTDCPTCHNTYSQTVGPAYIDIAKRYET